MITVKTDDAVKKAQRILKELDNKQLLYAQRRVFKRLVSKASSLTARETAKSERLPVKLLRERLRVKHLTVANNTAAQVRVFRNRVPAIRLGLASMQLGKKGAPVTSAVVRNANGQFGKREISGQTTMKVGKRIFKNVFLQQLKSGKWHVMQRTSDARYPIDVVGVDIEVPITSSAKRSFEDAILNELPANMLRELNYRINKATNG